MNIFERGLCVVQCKYVHSVVFSAPFAPTKAYLQNLPAISALGGAKTHPDAVYHGPTSFMPASFDAYADAKSLSIFTETPAHDFQDVNAAHIVKRILDNRAQYEERQRKKGVKGVGEEATLKRERMEREAADVLRKRKEEARKELQRRHSEVERQFGM
jgi:ethanolamine-phosphate cytidylyltransferase